MIKKRGKKKATSKAKAKETAINTKAAKAAKAKENEALGLMTVNQYAKARKVSGAYIYKLIKSGEIVKNADGYIDPVKANQSRKDNRHPTRTTKVQRAAVKAGKELDEKLTPEYEKDKEFKEIELFFKKALEEIKNDDGSEIDKWKDLYFQAVEYGESLLALIAELTGSVRTVSDSKKLQEHYKALLLEFQVLEKQKKLVNLQDFKDAVYGAYSKRDYGIKAELEAIAPKLAPQIRCCLSDAVVQDKIRKFIRLVSLRLVEAKYKIKPKEKK